MILEENFNYDGFDFGDLDSSFRFFGETYHDCTIGTMSFDESFDYCPLCHYESKYENLPK